MNFEISFYFHVGKNTCRGPCTLYYGISQRLFSSEDPQYLLIAKKELTL